MFLYLFVNMSLNVCACAATRLDADGSVVRHVAPSKPAGPYLITAAPDWWKLSDTASWKEPLFGGQYGPIWVSPMPTNEVAARLEMRVQSASGQRFTVGESFCHTASCWDNNSR
jgi:hypothetical protein